jgi:hypothetical protein
MPKKPTSNEIKRQYRKAKKDKALLENPDYIREKLEENKRREQQCQDILKSILLSRPFSLTPSLSGPSQMYYDGSNGKIYI